MPRTWGGRCVVKAQVHSGGRGEAGGVKLCTAETEVREFAASLLGSTLVTKQTGAGWQAGGPALGRRGL
jgi:malate-CoA ligase subunit beta